MELKEYTIEGKKQEVLLDAIPRLKKFDFKRGAEAIAYFIDNNFVVKTLDRVGMDYDFFVNYCKELQSFEDNGLAYPKVYSWASVPICKEDGAYKYYILEQRAQGEDLYPYDLYGIKRKALSFCSREEFDMAINYTKEHNELYTKIVQEFAKTILERNKQLETLSKSEIQRFINSYLEINKRSLFSTPDLHAGNIIFDGKHLTIIDGTMTYQSTRHWVDGDGKFNQAKFNIKSVEDILTLFTINAHIKSYARLVSQTNANAEELKSIIEENDKVLGKIMETWASECVSLAIPTTFSDYDIDRLETQIGGIMLDKNKQAIFDMLQGK